MRERILGNPPADGNTASAERLANRLAALSPVRLSDVLAVLKSRRWQDGNERRTNE